MDSKRIRKFIEKQGFDINDVRYLETEAGRVLDPACGRFVYKYMKKKYKAFEKNTKKDLN